MAPQWAPALSYGEALELTVWVGACFALVVGLGTRQVLRDFVPRYPPRYPLSARAFRRMPAAIFVAALTYPVLTAGINFSLPSLDDVYGVRAEFRQQQTSADPALGYVVRC